MQLKEYIEKNEDKNIYLPIRKFQIGEFLAEKYSTINNQKITEILDKNFDKYITWDYENFAEEVEKEILETNLNLISCVSGWWTTMNSLAGKLISWEISLVDMVWIIASKPNIWAIDKAIKHKIHTVILNKFHAKDSETLNWLAKLFKADIIIWNWWLPLIPKEVIESFEWVILNQHPWPLRKNWLDFGWKWMYWTRVTASRIIYLLKSWATWNELFTESTIHIMTEEIDEWYSVWVKRLDIEFKIEEYRNAINNINNEDEKKELLIDLISDIQISLLVLEHENVAETIEKVWITKTVEQHSSYDENLVPEENKEILENSKKEAIKLFPSG